MQSRYTISLEVDVNGEECAVITYHDKVDYVLLLEDNNLEKTCASYFNNSIHNQENYIGEKQ